MGHRTEEMSALADVYAEALLRAAEEQGQDEEVAAEFADLVRYMDTDPDFDAFLTAASVDDDPRRESLERLFRGRMSDLLLNLIQVMNNRERCDLIRATQRAVELRMEAKHQQKEVIVETAMSLTPELQESIKRTVGERIGKEVILIEELRPELIGGVVIHIGDMQIDASVASKLRRMHRNLNERATEEIQVGRGFIEQTE